MLDIKEHDKVVSGSDRNFGLVFAALFLVIGLWPLLSSSGVRWWALVVAVAFLAAAFIWPKSLAPLNRLWFKFGVLLGRIVGPIVMALIFFVTVTPTALIIRARGKDLLKLKADPSAKSYWVERDDARAGSMRDQF